ncbi:outer membrane beta-barrel protein [Spirochaetota bacterium]
MKILRLLVFALALLALAPAKSYALFDLGVYGGITFDNKVNTSLGDLKAYGSGFGFIGHYRTTLIPMVLSFGLGPYYESFYLTYDEYSTDYDYKKQTVGLDVYAMLELPIFIHPYFRASVAIWDDLNGHEEYFQSFAVGPGVGLNIAVIFQIYLEYLYSASWHDDKKSDGHTINLGVRVMF